jgi:hypothetical protein
MKMLSIFLAFVLVLVIFIPLSSAGQPGWKWCFKCSELTYAGLPDLGVCSEGGEHNHRGSANYVVDMSGPEVSGQRDWRWCLKCQALFYGGKGWGICPAGGSHDPSRSADYTLAYAGGPNSQSDWRWCNKCQALFHSSSTGSCAAGGAHDGSQSANYGIKYDM